MIKTSLTDKSRLYLCFIFIFVLLLVFTKAVRAGGPGDLDPSFDTDGIVITDFSGYDESNAIAIQTDGKILVGGWGAGSKFALARYNSDGSLDTSFDSDGKVTTSFGNQVALADIQAIAIQTDGKIVAAGYITEGGNQGDFALARYNTDGSLDTSFDSDGKVTTSVNTGDRSFAVAIQTDGKIVAAGYTGSYPADLMLVRYNNNGSLDTSFGVNGITVTDLGSDAGGFDLAIQTGGKILVASKYSGTLMLIRYNSDGTLDTSFDNDGQVYSVVGCNYPSCDLALQNDGKIVVTGWVYYYDFRMARYNSNGSLDTSFGTDGSVRTDFGGNDQAHDVVIQNNGKIVVSGKSSNDIALARYNSNGSLDSSFGNGGKVITDLGGDDYGRAVAIQTDGNILVTGEKRYGSWDFAVTRYLGCISPSPCLTITKAVQLSNIPIQPGDPLTYTIVVANQGAGNASNVAITDTLPTYIDGLDLNQMTDIAAGESVTFTLNVTLSNSVPFGEVITNTAFFSHTSDNGQEDSVFTVTGPPQLAITKTVQLSNIPIQPGDPLTYTIVVANQGAGNASNVAITDTLPTYIDGLDLNQMTDIAAGESVTFTLNVTLSNSVPFGEVITNTAFFSHTSDNGQDSNIFSIQEAEGTYLPIILKN